MVTVPGGKGHADTQCLHYGNDKPTLDLNEIIDVHFFVLQCIDQLSFSSGCVQKSES